MKKVFFALLLAAGIVLIILLINMKDQSTQHPYDTTGEKDVIQAEDNASGTSHQNIADIDGAKEDIDFIHDLKQIYNHTEIDVTDITDISDEYTLITVVPKISANKFFLYSSETGLYEELPVMGADLQTVIGENYFIFQDDGDGSGKTTEARLNGQILKVE